MEARSRALIARGRLRRTRPSGPSTAYSTSGPWPGAGSQDSWSSPWLMPAHCSHARRLPRMGQASRRKRQTDRAPKAQRAPFVSGPFEGLADEADWVAMREILPAATARITVVVPEGLEVDGHPVPAGEREVTLVTVLPGAMPAVHRDNGD